MDFNKYFKPKPPKGRMHITRLFLKNGKTINSILERQRLDPDVFENSYIKVCDFNEVFYIKEISSAITQRERVTINRIENLDEIANMKKNWEDYKAGKMELGEGDLVEPKYKLQRN